MRTDVSLMNRPSCGDVYDRSHSGWPYVGGVAFGLLPQQWRRRSWIGPAYGALFWAGYTVGIAPTLGLSYSRPAKRNVQRVALLADHLLYGVVVAASPWPYRD